MIIKPLDQADREQYNKYAKDYGTIFNSLEWLSIFDDKLKIYGIYNKGHKLIGGFSIYKEIKIGTSVYRNPPFTPSIGPFLKIDAQNPVSIMDTWKQVLSSMADFVESMPYSIVSFSFDKNIIDTQPFIWNKFKVIPAYTYLLDLKESIENIGKRMSSERRNDINKGIKDGLFVKQLHDLEIVKSLTLKTFSRQEKSCDKYYLNKILGEFAENKNSFAFATLKDNVPVACSFCIYDRNTAYYLIGGYDHKKKHHGAGALSVWESIKHAKKMGLQHFDFEGSMIPQIEKYFRGFGGKLTPYYRINKAKLPIEILLKFFKREMF